VPRQPARERVIGRDGTLAHRRVENGGAEALGESHQRGFGAGTGDPTAGEQ